MSQRVVQYGVLQKRMSLVSNRYFHLSTTQPENNVKNYQRKSVGQGLTTGVYLVTGCQ